MCIRDRYALLKLGRRHRREVSFSLEAFREPAGERSHRGRCGARCEEKIHPDRHEKPGLQSIENWRRGYVPHPTLHSGAVLEAANRGQFTLQADLYDGLDKGEKFYQTTTIIGKPIGDGASDLPAVANAEILNGMRAWPVTVSYFDSDKAGAITPSYEIAYRMYANGVSRKLRIDYGNFSVEGELNKIEFLKQVDCGTTATKPVKR